MPGLGKTLIITGLMIAFVGVVLTFSGKIAWFGRLPGDIFIKKESYTVYFPLVSCLILSILLSLILWLLKR
jgi:hypothetical protein